MMNRRELGKSRFWKHTMQVATCGLLGSGAAVGCLDRPLEPNEPRTTTTIVERLTQSVPQGSETGPGPVGPPPCAEGQGEHDHDHR